MDKLKSKDFWMATLARAIRTVCQTAIATIGTSALIGEVNWVVVLSSSGLAGIVSILTSIVMGIPEV